MDDDDDNIELATLYSDATKDTQALYDKIVELISEASSFRTDEERCSNLIMVHEFLVNQCPQYLDNFFDEFVAFQTDSSILVKKAVINFLEAACDRDLEMLPKVINHLTLLLDDDVVDIQKKVMLILPSILSNCVRWILASKNVSSEMETSWNQIKDMKKKIFKNKLDSVNDGIRTHAVKFTEGMVIVLSEKLEDSILTRKTLTFATLEAIPKNHNFFNWTKLEQEGKMALDYLLEFMALSHISSVNLMTCMNSLTNIAKQRPQFLHQIVQSFEAIHVNLPPTLAKSQVASVRKNLKLALLSVLNHPSSIDYHPQITTLLTDLGATTGEISKRYPKFDELKFRKRKLEEEKLKKVEEMAKKAKLDSNLAIMKDMDDDYGMTPFVSVGQPEKHISTEQTKYDTIENIFNTILPLLTPANVTDLVLVSMISLPDSMPPHFQSTFTPIAAAGTPAQIQHLARLLSSQIISTTGKQSKFKNIDDETQPNKETENSSAIQSISRIKSEPTPTASIDQKTNKIPPLKIPQPVRRVKQFKLHEITPKFTEIEREQQAMEAFRRILNAEKLDKFGAVTVRNKIIVSLVCTYGGEMMTVLLNYIFSDIKENSSLAILWLYQQFSVSKNDENNVRLSNFDLSNTGYGLLLVSLLKRLQTVFESGEALFTRIFLEAPVLTDEAINVLEKFCQDHTRAGIGLNTLKTLILYRPNANLLKILLCFSMNTHGDIRSKALNVTKDLYTNKVNLRVNIEEEALRLTNLLLNDKPPKELFQATFNLQETLTWNDELIKLCLNLYALLLPMKHSLIKHVENIYPNISADMKRTVLRSLEIPVRSIGMESPDLLQFVQNCPSGTETLVTRIIHVLTERSLPTPQLVKHVRDLYEKKVSDVRFLVPVLAGLPKSEILEALPKFMQLTPVVLKEVFNRVLGTSHSQTGPLTATELLITLHNIESSKLADVKTVIRSIGLLLQEKTICTQESIAAALQELVEQTPLPILIMRTALQALNLHPKLISFTMQLMQKLVQKNVWKNKRVWEGFIVCCQRTKPHCFGVLLQLPPPQLKSVFEVAVDLREILLDHVNKFPAHQKARISRALMQVLERDPVEELRLAEELKKKEQERIALQEKIYQQKLDEEKRMKEQEDNNEEDASSNNKEKEISEDDNEEKQDSINDEEMKTREMKDDDENKDNPNDKDNSVEKEDETSPSDETLTDDKQESDIRTITSLV